MNKKIQINVGILPYIYNGLNNYIKNISKSNNINLPEHLKHIKSDSREKAYIFYCILHSLYKNKTLNDYKSNKTKTKICKICKISERSYYRYIKYLINDGFAFEDDKNSNLLRLVQIKRICNDINRKYTSFLKSHKIFVGTFMKNNEIAYVDITTYDFKQFSLLMKLVYIKYDEEKKKEEIYKKIKKRNENSNIISDSYFILTNNIRSSKNKFKTNKYAQSFENVYSYIYTKSRGKSPLKLSTFVLSSNSHVVDTDINNTSYDKFGIIDIRRSQYSLLSRKEKKKYCDNVIDIIASKNVDNINNKIDSLLSSSKNNIFYEKTMIPINTTNTIYMSVAELNYISNLAIMTPQQYYKLLVSDNGLLYKRGYTRLGKILGISKSQVSRLINSMVDNNMLKVTRRFVYICSVNSTSPRSLINNMSTQYSMMYENNESLISKSFNRIRYLYGNILFEIESDKHSNISIFFNFTEHEKLIKTTELMYMKKYEKLQSLLYGDNIDMVETKYNKKLQQKGKENV